VWHVTSLSESTSDCCATRTRECDKGTCLVRSICVQLQIASLCQQAVEMPHCMVPGCTNDSKKTTGVSYHRLPQDKRRKAVWLARIPRANPCPSKYSFVCSAHFSPESFVTDLAEQLCGQNNRRRLTLNAVPTIFPQSPLYVAPRKPRLTSERRSLKRAEQQVSYYILS